MPRNDGPRHRRKAERNMRFRSEIESVGNGYPEWEVTAAFYAAVHLVQAYLLTFTHDRPRDHTARKAAIGRASDLRSIQDDYEELYDLSRGARYDCSIVRSDDVAKALKLLANIKGHIDSLIARRSGQP